MECINKSPDTITEVLVLRIEVQEKFFGDIYRRDRKFSRNPGRESLIDGDKKFALT